MSVVPTVVLLPSTVDRVEQSAWRVIWEPYLLVGLWVHPKHRGKGLYVLRRALCIVTNHDFDTFRLHPMFFPANRDVIGTSDVIHMMVSCCSTRLQ